jgi:hypothetical protein
VIFVARAALAASGWNRGANVLTVLSSVTTSAPTASATAGNREQTDGL